MAPPPILSLQDIKLTLGGKPLLEGADLSVAPGERICLVGRNGSGKSTLLKIAAGMIEKDGGMRFFQPDATVRYLPQEPDLSDFADVLGYVEAGLGPNDDLYRAQYLLSELGLRGDENPAHLSGGEIRRAALARVLAPEPDLLFLDEPTNHLDLPAIEWLESELASLRSALVLISHDRRFLQNLSRTTVWLDRGRTKRLDRGFGEFEAWRDKVIEEEERDRHKLDRQIVNEEHWVRHGVSGRRKRNMGRMDRLGDLRQERREARNGIGDVKFSVSEGRTSGKLVTEGELICKSWGDRPIVKDFSIRILRGDRLGIVGSNGAGKTTLLNILTGKLEPDSGHIKLGASLEMATLDQSRKALKPEWTLKDALTNGGGDFVDINGEKKHVIGYMKDFLVAPEQARTPISRLSGGERGRLMLARALSLPSNFLVLDEPTNDLDLETLDLLQEMIADYPGTVVVVSHDRDFLDRVSTSVLVAEGEGKWIEYAGGYTDMVAQRGFGIGQSAPAAVLKTPKAEAKERAAASGDKKKLSFKHKHALETLPGRIDELSQKRALIQSKLEAPDLYARDRSAFDKLSQQLLETEKKIASMEEEWLELEALRETVEG